MFAALFCCNVDHAHTLHSLPTSPAPTIHIHCYLNYLFVPAHSLVEDTPFVLVVYPDGHLVRCYTSILPSRFVSVLMLVLTRNQSVSYMKVYHKFWGRTLFIVSTQKPTNTPGQNSVGLCLHFSAFRSPPTPFSAPGPIVARTS